ncbi:MAG TPA: sigma-70 family RNA polymerase sigma factor [Kofleriaceae bacterium]|nr:sigma-70 family RNA polymerase sigma factor [Kofleriaceae bacterium]
MGLVPTDKTHGSSTVGDFARIDGHEIAAPPHVGDEMQARALSPSVTRPDEPTLVDPTQDTIAALVAGGKHREALAACARHHGHVVGRLCMALLGSQADADEATQETLLRAHRAMATYRGEGSIKAWLCGIARHVCAHMLETRRKGRELSELVPVPDTGEAREQFANRQRARAIRDAMANLKPSERDVLVLRYVADLSHREIATTCNLDEATARKRLSRALARLRSAMPEKDL